MKGKQKLHFTSCMTFLQNLLLHDVSCIKPLKTQSNPPPKPMPRKMTARSRTKSGDSTPQTNQIKKHPPKKKIGRKNGQNVLLRNLEFQVTI